MLVGMLKWLRRLRRLLKFQFEMVDLAGLEPALPSLAGMESGSLGPIRTDDPQLFKLRLYQLSYQGIGDTTKN